MNDRLQAAMAELAAEALRASAPDIEATLLAEFTRVRGRRRAVWPYWAAGIAAAALLAVAVSRQSAKAPAGVPAPRREIVAQVEVPAPRRLAAAVPVHQRRPRARPKAEPEQPFVPIPYTVPLAPYERAEVVRVDVPVSALIAAGFPMQITDPGGMANADLVMGPDGRARAVRLISISNSTGVSR